MPGKRNLNATGLSVKLDPAIIDRLHKLAEARGLSFEQMNRQILTEAVADLDGSGPAEIWTSFYRRISPALNELIARLSVQGVLIAFDYDPVAGVFHLRQREMEEQIRTITVEIDRGDLYDFLEEAECGASEASERYCRAYEALLRRDYPGADVSVQTVASIGHTRVTINGERPGYGEAGDYDAVDSLANELVNDWSWLAQE